MIFDFWQEHLKKFPNLLDKQDFSPQEIGRYKAMIERLIIQGKMARGNLIMMSSIITMKGLIWLSVHTW